MGKNNFWNERSIDYFKIKGELKLTTLHPKVIECIDHSKKLNVLDFGCGDGDLANQLAIKGHRVFAVDKSQPVIQEAKSNFTESNNLRFEKVIPEIGKNGYKNIVSNGKFDIIILSLVVITISNNHELKVILDVLKQCLNKNGQILFADSTPYSHNQQFSTFKMSLDLKDYHKSVVPFKVEIFDGFNPQKSTSFYDYHRSLKEILTLFSEFNFKVLKFIEVYDNVETPNLHKTSLQRYNDTLPPFLIITFGIN